MYCDVRPQKGGPKGGFGGQFGLLQERFVPNWGLECQLDPPNRLNWIDWIDWNRFLGGLAIFNPTVRLWFLINFNEKMIKKGPMQGEKLRFGGSQLNQFLQKSQFFWGVVQRNWKIDHFLDPHFLSKTQFFPTQIEKNRLKKGSFSGVQLQFLKFFVVVSGGNRRKNFGPTVLGLWIGSKNVVFSPITRTNFKKLNFNTRKKWFFSIFIVFGGSKLTQKRAEVLPNPQFPRFLGGQKWPQKAQKTPGKRVIPLGLPFFDKKWQFFPTQNCGFLPFSR